MKKQERRENNNENVVKYGENKNTAGTNRGWNLY
jgi:hypothetical protein